MTRHGAERRTAARRRVDRAVQTGRLDGRGPAPVAATAAAGRASGRPEDVDARVRRIVVALDDGAAAWGALHQAAALARPWGAAVTVLHAPRPVWSPFDGASGLRRAVDRARADGEALLRRAAGELGSGVPATTELLEGDPAGAVCARAAELGADLLVVGSRRRGALGRLFGGGVGQAIVRCAPCPVLVVPVGSAVASPTVAPRAGALV
jgi:nucleotide-binding universal stress UspA family protein